MSRSNPQEDTAKNPATKFLRWDSDKNVWRYWDKEAEERRELPMNTPFIFLDSLFAATGFNQPKNCGIWSNEVRNVKHQLVVQDKDGEVFSGTWQEVKAKLDYAKFCTSVYAMAKVGDGYELVNFQLSGCALGPWIDFVKEQGGQKELEGDIVLTVKEYEHKKIGRVEFNAPVFGVATRKLTDEARAQAEEMDKTLQQYLAVYLEHSPQAKAVKEHSKSMEAYEAPVPNNAPIEKDEEDDFPF